ncbi:hypothetical protein LguiB_035502 [Lonicera macranthoides]
MVSSQLNILTKTHTCKSFQNQLLFPINPPDVPSDHVELDFSDVFGPLPVQDSNELDASELIYDDPVVIYSRSHSLVGPSACVSHSLKLSKLTIHETEDSVELFECVNDDDIIISEAQDSSVHDSAEESLALVNDNFAKVQSVGLEDFEVMKVVGQGAFGKVFQVRKKGTSEVYAMKVMRKDKIMEKNHAEYMKAERDILTKIDHPFIVQLRYSFQTLPSAGLYEWGTPLFSALPPRPFQALLTDFGLAKQFEENKRSNSLCGTVEYMSPEIVLGKGHDKAADWWSVGILLFEMLTGKPPFVGGNREKIQQKIIKDKIKLPAFLSSEAHSLLKGLLQKDPGKRLGSGPTGSEDVKRHKWFKPINWKKLEAREIQPSFCPEVAGKQCIANFDKRWTDMPLLDSPASSPKTENLFQGFTYVRPASSYLQRNNPLC